MIDSTNIDLTCWVFGQVIHYIFSHVFNWFETTQWDSTDWVDSNMIKKTNSNCMTNILKYFLGEWWAICVCIYLWSWVSHCCFFFDTSLTSVVFRSQCINSFPIMVITFKCITICYPCCSLKWNTTTPIPTHSIFIFNCHNFLWKIALVHIKIKAIHSYKFCKSDIVCLSVILR